MSKLTWYIARLKNMSSAEIQYRMQQKGQAWYERFTLASRTRLSDENSAVNSSLYFDAANLDLAFFEKNPQIKEKILGNAEKFLEHRFTIFRAKDVHFGNTINWHLDFISGREWPRKFYAKLSYRNADVGASKWIMELNRHQHFFTLGQAWLITKEEKYAAEIVNQMLSWIDQNPYLIGINWYSGLEMALRLISWTWALNALSDFAGITSHKKHKILEALFNQAEFIEKHHVRFSSANNHLIGEATGLVLAGLFFIKNETAAYWLKKGLAILENEIERQILPDGMSAEQSTHYLAFALDFYLIGCIALLRAGRQLPEIYNTRFKEVADLIHDWQDARGLLPDFGDGDNGCIYFPEYSDTRFSSILNSIGLLSDEPALCSENLKSDPVIFWLWHWHENYQSCLEKECPPYVNNESKFRSHAGYFSMKSSDPENRHQMIFDCGNLGLQPMAAHGHADALSFTLNMNGVPMLIDPGTYAYYYRLPWKNYFRGTAAHNTLTVDGLDQSQIVSYFVWQNQAQVKIRQQTNENEFDFIVAEHDGYNRLNHRVWHQRQVLYIKNYYWLIVDLGYGFGRHHFEQNFHFAAEGQLVQEGRIFKYSFQKQTLFLCPLEEDAEAANIFRGSMNPLRGWWSPKFHELEQTTTLTIGKMANCPAIFGTALWPGHLQAQPKRIQKLIFKTHKVHDAAHQVGLQIHHSEGCDYYFHARQPDSRISFDGFEFEGQMLWLRQNRSRQVEKYIAMNVKRLGFNGNVFVEGTDFQEVVYS